MPLGAGYPSPWASCSCSSRWGPSPAAVALGGTLMAWIAIQVALIGPVSRLQPFYFVLGLLEAALGYLLWRSGG